MWRFGLICLAIGIICFLVSCEQAPNAGVPTDGGTCGWVDMPVYDGGPETDLGDIDWDMGLGFDFRVLFVPDGGLIPLEGGCH